VAKDQEVLSGLLYDQGSTAVSLVTSSWTIVALPFFPKDGLVMTVDIEGVSDSKNREKSHRMAK
jgi:hypothetical protein